VFRKVGYFQGYNLGRECLNMDATQIDSSKYTHIHFAFGLLTPKFEVKLPDESTKFQFQRFKTLKVVKRILAFGGWDFSASLATYAIFRNAFTGTNRATTVKNIAKFINDHGLDGVDIDWEYPGTLDIPDLPPGGALESQDYLRDLSMLKDELKDKSVSIAAPVSFHYLKQYPIQNMEKFLDYIVFMTYDLHGQWDYANKWTSPGCAQGNCLRSQVNMTDHGCSRKSRLPILMSKLEIITFKVMLTNSRQWSPKQESRPTKLLWV